MSILRDDGVTKVEAVAISEETLTAAYNAAMKAADKYARRCAGHADKFRDAATDAIIVEPGAMHRRCEVQGVLGKRGASLLLRTSWKLRERDERRPNGRVTGDGGE